MTATCHRAAHDAYVKTLRNVLNDFVDTIGAADPEAKVPSCPDWTVSDLAIHVGGIHRWAGTMVQRLSQQALTRADIDLQLPADASGHPAWLTAGGELLLDALAGVDPDAPMWGWGSDQHARFWSRRMVHETSMHTVDALLSLQRAPAMPTAIAVDGIDEFLDNLPCAQYFAPNVTKLRGNGETIAFSATDAHTVWRITLEPERFRWDHDDTPADVTVQGIALDLLLVAYGRQWPDTAVTVDGNRQLLDRWLTNSSI